MKSNLKTIFEINRFICSQQKKYYVLNLESQNYAILRISTTSDYMLTLVFVYPIIDNLCKLQFEIQTKKCTPLHSLSRIEYHQYTHYPLYNILYHIQMHILVHHFCLNTLNEIHIYIHQHNHCSIHNSHDLFRCR